MRSPLGARAQREAAGAGAGWSGHRDQPRAAGRPDPPGLRPGRRRRGAAKGGKGKRRRRKRRSSRRPMGAAAPAQRWPGGGARAVRKSAREPLGRRRPQVPRGPARPRLLPHCCGLAAVAAPGVGPEGRRREGSGAVSRDREGPRLAPCAAVRCLLPVLWEPAAAVGPSRCLRVSAGGGRREERGAGTQLLVS